MITTLCLLVVLSVVFYMMTPGERRTSLRAALATILRLKEAATRPRPDLEPFRDALRARTPWALVTPALVVLNVTIFVCLLSGAGALNAPATLISWGANFGPRTTNGEWWRLATTMFLHTGMLHLVVNIAGFIQVGLMLERLVGRIALATVYFLSGVLAGLVSLSAHPVAVSVGASGAIFGIYGLLLASLLSGRLHRSALTIPLRALWRLAPAAMVFVVYTAATGRLEREAAIDALAAGLVWGLVLTIQVRGCKPPVRRLVVAMVATIVIVIASAVPMRGVADVRPEIARVVAAEDRTASAYWSAVGRFRDRRMTAEALALLIDRTIRPELQAALVRLEGIEGVPPEQRPLVSGAEEYLHLRDESWSLRAEGLRKTNMLKLRQAERQERASLEALKKITP